jgi:hypothetical protein
MPYRFENGYFALVLTCALALLTIAYVSFYVAYSKGYQSADQEHAAYYTQRDTAEVAYRECLQISSTLSGARECVDNAEEASRDSERAEQDLNAQREMAQWAEGMLWAAWSVGILTAGITIIGVRYVYLTLVSSQATVALIRSEQRPWLSASIGKIVDYHFVQQPWHDAPKSLYIYVPVSIRNSGKTPAHNVFLTVEAYNIPEAYEAKEITLKGMFKGFRWERGAIAPNGELSDDYGTGRRLDVTPEGKHAIFMCFVVVSIHYSAEVGENYELLTCQMFSLKIDHPDAPGTGLHADILREHHPTIIAAPMGGAHEIEEGM